MSYSNSIKCDLLGTAHISVLSFPCLTQKCSWIYWELLSSFQVATVLRFLQSSVSVEKFSRFQNTGVFVWSTAPSNTKYPTSLSVYSPQTFNCMSQMQVSSASTGLSTEEFEEIM